MSARNIWIAIIAVFCAVLLISGPDYLRVPEPILFIIVLAIVPIASRFIPKTNEK